VATARIAHYDVGDFWTPQATFTVGGVATDPTTITVTQQAPDGTESVLAAAVSPAGLNASSTPFAKTGTGVFKVNPGVAITAAGRWYVKFTGTGAAAASDTHVAIGDPDPFTLESGVGSRALVTLEDAKDWLQQQGVDFSEDLELVRVINDISDRFMREAEREFKVDGTNPQVRTFIAEPVGRRQPWYIDGDYVGDHNSSRRRIKVGDMMSAPTQVQLMDSDWTTVLETPALADITALPSPRGSGDPITELEFHSDVTSMSSGMRVKVTGSFGFPSVPGDVRQAVLDAVAATMDRDVEHYRQDLGAGQAEQEGGTVVVVGRSGGRLISLPPSAQAVAWRYRATSISVG
jgi:hypothetical protein